LAFIKEHISPKIEDENIINPYTKMLGACTRCIAFHLSILTAFSASRTSMVFKTKTTMNKTNRAIQKQVKASDILFFKKTPPFVFIIAYKLLFFNCSNQLFHYSLLLITLPKISSDGFSEE